MPDYSTGSFKLRDPEPGKIELCLSVDGQTKLLPVTYRALWGLVKDGTRMLSQYPLDKARDDIMR